MFAILKGAHRVQMNTTILCPRISGRKITASYKCDENGYENVQQNNGKDCKVDFIKCTRCVYVQWKSNGVR